jgi:hypothetical protein
MRLLTAILAVAVSTDSGDLAFQAPDSDAVLLVHARPEVGDEPPGQVEVALLLRKGMPPLHWKAADLLQPGELRIDSGRMTWLLPQGSRVVRGGAELWLASGRRLVLPFDGSSPSRGSQPVPVAAPACPCSYTDDGGVYHVVTSASDVPPQYRGRLQSLSSDTVQVMPMPAPELHKRAEEAPSAPSPQKSPPRARPPADGEDNLEYVRRITGQRGPQYRVNCIDNDGKPTSCDWLEWYGPYPIDGK